VTDSGERRADPQRRSVLKGGSLLALAYSLDGLPALLTPRAAHAQGVALQVLTAAERAALEAVGEVLVPGARAAGLAEYVDQQLAADFGDCLLAARVLDVAPPLAAFYHAALASIDGAARHVYGQAFAALSEADRTALVKTMARHDPDGWHGAPAPFVFYLLRSDAIDVYYGTVEAYERLGVPYMPHIVPQKAW
jgi:hypothetical protein